MSEEKAALRKEIRAQLKALNADKTDAAEKSRRAARVLTESPAFKECGAVLAFLSFGTEIQTHDLVRAMLADGKRVAVPRTFEDESAAAFESPVAAFEGSVADKTAAASKTAGAASRAAAFESPVADKTAAASKTAGAADRVAAFESSAADKASSASKTAGAADSRMEFYWLSADVPLEEQLEKGDFGILVPRLSLPQVDPAALPEKTLFVLPGVAFSKAGWRLGQGRGFYDRFLERVFKSGQTHTASRAEARVNERDSGRRQEHVTLAGFCYALQLISDVPHDSWDKPVDMIVTEDGVTVAAE